MDAAAARLVALIELFAERTGRRVSTASRLATGSGDVVARLRRGAAISTRRADKALRFLSENWPEGLPWPPQTPRPGGGRGSGGRERRGGSDDQFAELLRRLAEHFKRHDDRFAAIDERFRAIAAHLVAHDKRFDAAEQRLDAMERRFDRLEGIVTQIRGDLVQIGRALGIDRQTEDLQRLADRGPAA